MSSVDGKMLINSLYHSGVVTILAVGFSRLSKMVIGGAPPKLDLTPRDVGLIMLDITSAMFVKDLLIKQGIIPTDIVQ
jgi:hypothetical protein